MNALHIAARAALALGLFLAAAVTASAAGSWVQTSTGLGSAQVLVLAVDPAKPATLYAGTKGNGVYKSVDGGAHWAPAGTELANAATSGRVNAIAIDPTATATVYAGTDGGVYKSLDGGAHWAPASTGLTTLEVSALAVDPHAPSNVYAGTRVGGMFRSGDGGSHWAAANNGISLPASVWGLSFSATNPQALWAVMSTTYYDILIATTDAGASWSESYPGFNIDEPMVKIADFLLRKIGLKGLRFTNPDGFWPGYSPMPSLPPGVGPEDCLPVSEVVADPQVPTRVYVAGLCMMQGSVADGSLALMNLGLPKPRQMNALVVTPDGATLYAAVDGSGVWTYQVGAVPNFGGIWWNAPPGSESGWGINFAHQGDVIFATWFTYDASGKPLWLIMSATKTADNRYEGTLYTTSGPAFSAVPFDPAQVTANAVGQGSLTFTDANSATFAYTVNGITQTKTIAKQVFAAPVPNCVFGAQSDLASALNYQDMWWASPAGVESGWGVNLAHQGNTIFATWFTYGADHAPLWLIATVTPKAGTTSAYEGTIYKTSGPAFSAVPFDPAQVKGSAVGTLTITFADGNAAAFAYTLDGVTQSKTITRQVFRTPGTVCR